MCHLFKTFFIILTSPAETSNNSIVCTNCKCVMSSNFKGTCVPFKFFNCGFLFEGSIGNFWHQQKKEWREMIYWSDSFVYYKKNLQRLCEWGWNRLSRRYNCVTICTSPCRVRIFSYLAQGSPRYNVISFMQNIPFPLPFLPLCLVALIISWATMISSKIFIPSIYLLCSKKTKPTKHVIDLKAITLVIIMQIALHRAMSMILWKASWWWTLWINARKVIFHSFMIALRESCSSITFQMSIPTMSQNLWKKSCNNHLAQEHSYLPKRKWLYEFVQSRMDSLIHCSVLALQVMEWAPT